MYATNFDYYRARSLADVHALIAAHPGAKLLAGGHSLVPLLKLRLAAPAAVIDIGRVAELRGIARQRDDVRIGALTTHAELAASAELRTAAQALAEAASWVGDPAVRNRGTIGGNVAHADPASDLPTVLVALDARMIVAGPKGERLIPADQFFTGIMTTALGEDEILTGVQVPVAPRGQASAYEKFSHPASRYAVLGAAASIALKDGTCTAARIAIGGLLPSARRAPRVEKALVGKALTDETIAAAAAEVAGDLGNDVIGDLFASAEYRSEMAPIYVKRAITTAVQRAR
jgi:carbon-monoxide dehydrogenase medium subunit